MEIVLREAGEEDLVILAGLVRAAFEEYRGRLDPPSGAHGETEESLREKLEAGGALLAFLNGQPAGCVLYRPEEDFMY